MAELTGRRRWWTLVVLSLGVSLIVIDGTIVNVSLPVIIADLHMGLTGAQWITTIYTLVFAGLLITTGRLGDRLGRRRLFAAGVVIFVCGSLLAGTASGAAVLLGARVVQGIGGALVLPSTLSTVNAMFRGRDRVIAFGVWGSVISGMAGVGPLLGGWLTTSLSWRWIFFINLPVGLILLAGILAFVPESRGRGFAPGLDLLGFLLSALGLAALVFGLVEGRTYGWGASRRALRVGGLTWPAGAPISVAAAAIVAGGALLVGFVLWERHRAQVGKSALLQLSLFRLGSFRWGNTAALLVAVAEFGLLFTLPLYLENALGLSPIGSGLVLAAMAGGAFLAGGAAGELARAISPPAVATLGLALEVIGIVVTGFVLGPATPGWLIAAVLVSYGAGLGLASAQLTSVVLRDVPAEQSGQGSATQSTVRQLGSALGTAVLGTVLGTALTAYAGSALAGIRGITPGIQDRLADQLGSTAGGLIPQLQAGHPHVPDPARVTAALTEAFAHGARLSLLIAAGILVLGLACTVRLQHLARTRSPKRQPGRGPAPNENRASRRNAGSVDDAHHHRGPEEL
jgi:EmrB/QacA subfamily drug resistance transporter